MPSVDTFDAANVEFFQKHRKLFICSCAYKDKAWKIHTNNLNITDINYTIQCTKCGQYLQTSTLEKIRLKINQANKPSADKFNSADMQLFERHNSLLKCSCNYPLWRVQYILKESRFTIKCINCGQYLKTETLNNLVHDTIQKTKQATWYANFQTAITHQLACMQIALQEIQKITAELEAYSNKKESKE